MAASGGHPLQAQPNKESIMIIWRKKIQTAALLFFLLLPGRGPIAQDAPTSADDIRAGKLEAHMSVLAADFTRGRDTGSEGYDIAAAYAASLFKAWGIQPGGDFPDTLVRLRTGRGRSYFQAVPLVRNTSDPETVMTLTVSRGGFRSEAVFRRGTDFDVNSTVPFDFTAEVVFVGYGGSGPDFDEMKNLDLRNKIVVRLEGLPGQTEPDGAFYKKNRQARQAWVERFNQAARNGDAEPVAAEDPIRRFNKALRDGGAAGCITVALPPADASSAASSPAVNTEWGVNAPFRNSALPTLKMYEGDEPPAKRKRLRLPGGPVMAPAGGEEFFLHPGDPIMITASAEAAETLFAQAGLSLEELRRRIDSTGRPASCPLTGVLLRVRNEVRTEIVIGKNVIGVVPGADPALKNEIVVVAAHLDHIGALNGAIFNGADDNASGAAAVLELARVFSGLSNPPKRTIVFGLWCGEEDGFLGARYFVSRPYASLSNIVAILNLDMVGRLSRPSQSGEGKFVVSTSCQTPIFKRIAQESCQRAGLEAEFLEEKFDGWKKNGGNSLESDHAAFAARGIGYIFMSTGTHEDWHSFLDHPDKINFEGMEKIVRAAFGAAREIAGLDARPIFDKSIAPPKNPSRLRIVMREAAEEWPAVSKSGDGAAFKETPSRPPMKTVPSDSEATKSPAGTKASPDTRTFRLTFDLQGKTDDSRFEGKIVVSSAGRKVFESDTIILRGFRQERVYSREFDVAGLDLAAAGLRWEIQGTLFDSKLNDSSTFRKMDSRAFSAPFQGFGFHISTAGGTLDVRPVVF
jgi:hypothetical protein